MTTIADLGGRGLCAEADPEMFFPENGEHGLEARRLCAMCPVREVCLQIALQDGVAGIWGGLSHKERRALGAPGLVSVAEMLRACGTEAGAKRHQRHGEPTCGPCATAAARAALERTRAHAAAVDRGEVA